MKDLEKLLILLYEASQEEDERFPSDKIAKIWDEKTVAMLLEELKDKGFINTNVEWGFGGNSIICVVYPLLTYAGEHFAKELIKPWWQKLKFKQFIAVGTVCAILMLGITFLSNMDKIEKNYHNYISNGRLVSFIVAHMNLK